MRNIAFIICLIFILPLHWGQLICAAIFRSERAFVSVGNFLSLHPGLVGDTFRKAYYRLALEYFAPTAGLGFGSYFAHRNSRMGDNSSCGSYCVLGTCDIGKGVLLGSGVQVLSGKNQHAYDNDGKLVAGRFERIKIGDNTWIGNGAIIMAPVGEGCVIGAGAVVTRQVENNCIVGGNPAQVIKKRVTND